MGFKVVESEDIQETYRIHTKEHTLVEFTQYNSTLIKYIMDTHEKLYGCEVFLTKETKDKTTYARHKPDANANLKRFDRFNNFPISFHGEPFRY